MRIGSFESLTDSHVEVINCITVSDRSKTRCSRFSTDFVAPPFFDALLLAPSSAGSRRKRHSQRPRSRQNQGLPVLADGLAQCFIFCNAGIAESSIRISAASAWVFLLSTSGTLVRHACTRETPSFLARELLW